MREMTQLQRLLRARRPDLLDGFPAKLSLKALTTDSNIEFKKTYLNELLAPYRIEVILGKAEPGLLDGFKDAGVLGASTYTDGSIEVRVSTKFFKVGTTPSPLERALRFQSLTSHELVHRKQFKERVLHGDGYRSDEDLSSEEYLNDQLELQAMAAEVAHDVAVGSMLDSPRLLDLRSNAHLLKPESLTSFSAALAAFNRS